MQFRYQKPQKPAVRVDHRRGRLGELRMRVNEPLTWRTWNKMLVISCSVAAVGILVCAGGLLDILVPKGSIFWFMFRVATLAGVIALVVAGYVWICDKCEDCLSGYLDRLLDRQPRRPGAAANTKKPPTSGKADDRDDVHQSQHPGASGDRYVESLRGGSRPNSHSPSAMFVRKRWHGQ
jgi:hypothetical protein